VEGKGVRVNVGQPFGHISQQEHDSMTYYGQTTSNENQEETSIKNYAGVREALRKKTEPLSGTPKCTKMLPWGGKVHILLWIMYQGKNEGAILHTVAPDRPGPLLKGDDGRGGTRGDINEVGWGVKARPVDIVS